jgi:hypothetical protein
VKLRAALLVVALLPLGAATTAHAVTKPKVKPVCQVIKDASGDAAYNGAVPGDGNDDVVSGDIASDGKTLTGVIRLAALAQPDPMAPFGQGFFVRFTPKGTDKVLFVSARTYPQGTSFVYGYAAPDPTSGINTSYTLGTAKGVVDTAKKEVRISAPVAAFNSGAQVKLVKGLKLLSPTADTWRLVGQGVVPSQEVGGTRVPLGGLLLPFDDASGPAYVMGTPSCVKLGA